MGRTSLYGLFFGILFLSELVFAEVPLIIAHRGASFLAPEETAPAYIVARELGAEYLEADLHRTADGKIIAVHDDDLIRTTDIVEKFYIENKILRDPIIFPEDYLIRNLSWDLIAQLDSGSWYNEKVLSDDKTKKLFRKNYAGLKILTLEDLLSIAEGNYPGAGDHHPGLYLEFKSPDKYPGIEKEVVGILTKRQWIDGNPKFRMNPKNLCRSSSIKIGDGPGRIIFQSFDPRSIKTLATLTPAVPKVFLFNRQSVRKAILGSRKDSEEKITINQILDFSIKIGADGIAPAGNIFGTNPVLIPYIYLQFKKLVARAHHHRSKKIFVHPYTIDSQIAFHLFSKSDVDGFFTNRTDVAREFYGKRCALSLENLVSKMGF